MTLRETFRRISTDIEAMRVHRNIRRSFAGTLFILFNPSIVAIALYRISRYFYVKKVRSLAWLISEFQIYITGTEILPSADIGESFVIIHPVGVCISGKIGKNCIVTAQVGIGGSLRQGDVGAGNGLPVIGDNVWVGVGSKVLGPIRVGDGVLIGAMSLVLHDVPDGATVQGIPARVTKIREDTRAFWNIGMAPNSPETSKD